MNEMELNLGAKIHCVNGECGKLAKLVLQPDTFIVTHFIAEEGFLLKRARVFPISLVARTTTNDIYLNGTSDQLTDYPDYHEETIEKPNTQHISDVLHETGPYMTVTSSPMMREKLRHGVPQDATVIERGLPVQNNHPGSGGKLDSLVITPESGEITRLVVHHGVLFTEQTTIPITDVQHIGERAIALNG